MSVIYANEAMMQQCSEKLRRQKNEIMSVQEKLKTAMNRLDEDISIKASLRARLRVAYSKCEEHGANMDEMQKTVLTICGMYRFCENSILQGQVQQSGQLGEQELEKKYADVLAFANDPDSVRLFERMDMGREMSLRFGVGDGILVSLNKMGDTLVNLIKGTDYETEAIKETLAKMLQSMEKRTAADTVPDEIKLLVSSISKGLKLDEGMKGKYKDLLKGLDKLGDFIKYGDKGIEYLEYIFTDYSESIKTLELMKSNCGDNAAIARAVDFLTAEYQNKFFGSADKLLDYAINAGSDKALDAATGGLYSLSMLGKDVLMEVTGRGAKADAWETLIACRDMENAVSQNYHSAMDVLRSGSFTEADVQNAQAAFDLYKASTVTQYESALEIIKTDFKYDSIIANIQNGAARNQYIAAIEAEIDMIKGLQMDTASLARAKGVIKSGFGGSGGRG